MSLHFEVVSNLNPTQLLMRAAMSLQYSLDLAVGFPSQQYQDVSSCRRRACCPSQYTVLHNCILVGKENWCMRAVATTCTPKLSSSPLLKLTDGGLFCLPDGLSPVGSRVGCPFSSPIEFFLGEGVGDEGSCAFLAFTSLFRVVLEAGLNSLGAMAFGGLLNTISKIHVISPLPLSWPFPVLLAAAPRKSL